MKKTGKPHIQKQFNPVVFGIKVFVFVAVFANIAVLGLVLRNRKLGKKDDAGKLPSYVSVSPESVDFGEVQYGRAAVKKLKITNTGRNKIYFSRIMSSHVEFMIQPQFPGIELKNGEYVEVNVVYKPMFPGAADGKLTIESSDVGAKYFEVQCSGIGVMPRVTIEPGSLDFGNIQQDNASVTKTIIIKNSGTADLNVSSVGINSQSFSVTGSLPTVPLKPGESIKLNITYQPSNIGENDCTITVLSSDPLTPELKVPVIAAFKKAEGDWAKKQRAKARLDESKRLLNSAYMKLHSRASSEIRRRELMKQGAEELEKAWPVYKQSNEELQRLDPALVDNDFYFENGMLEKRGN